MSTCSTIGRAYIGGYHAAKLLSVEVIADTPPDVVELCQPCALARDHEHRVDRE